ncbi:hypothetical protein PGT21_032310 [Puccinia graminis f. sp. tritici]|nr:hypothetical protein PGT21_032310 [Puccinia graminis f. sp. tritici]
MDQLELHEIGTVTLHKKLQLISDASQVFQNSDLEYPAKKIEYGQIIQQCYLEKDNDMLEWIEKATLAITGCDIGLFRVTDNKSFGG